MYTKSIQIAVESEIYKVDYIKNIIDETETIFSINVLANSKEYTLNFCLHYYPKKIDKSSFPVFHDEVLDFIKLKVASAVINNENLPL